MHPSWMSQAVSMAIYVQTIGAFVWLFVVVLLERARRGERARVLRLESLADLQGKSLAGLWKDFTEARRATDKTSELQMQAIDALRLELNLPALSDRPTDAAPAEEHEKTDPAFRLPSGIEQPKPIESVQVDDEPTDSVTDGHWECVGCRQVFPLDESSFHAKCEKCGGSIELVTFPNGQPFRHLPLAGATERK
jgi:hypothetical protein